MADCCDAQVRTLNRRERREAIRRGAPKNVKVVEVHTADCPVIKGDHWHQEWRDG